MFFRREEKTFEEKVSCFNTECRKPFAGFSKDTKDFLESEELKMNPKYEFIVKMGFHRLLDTHCTLWTGSKTEELNQLLKLKKPVQEEEKKSSPLISSIFVVKALTKANRRGTSERTMAMLCNHIGICLPLEEEPLEVYNEVAEISTSSKVLTKFKDMMVLRAFEVIKKELKARNEAFSFVEGMDKTIQLQQTEIFTLKKELEEMRRTLLEAGCQAGEALILDSNSISPTPERKEEEIITDSRS